MRRKTSEDDDHNLQHLWFSTVLQPIHLHFFFFEMQRKCYLFIFGLLFEIAVAQSTLSYDAVLVIVIIELVFAFSIGIVCILFSYNLYRAIKLSDSAQNLNNIESSADNNGPEFDAANVLPYYGALAREDEQISVDNSYGPEREKPINFQSSIEHEEDLDDDDEQIDIERKNSENGQADSDYDGSILQSFIPFLKLW